MAQLLPQPLNPTPYQIYEDKSIDDSINDCCQLLRWAQLLPPREGGAPAGDSDASDQSDDSERPDRDHDVHPMVMNIGYRPTVQVLFSNCSRKSIKVRPSQPAIHTCYQGVPVIEGF